MRNIYSAGLFLLLGLMVHSPLVSSGEREPVTPGPRARSAYGDSGIMAGLSFPPFSGGDQIAFTLDKLDRLSLDRIRIALDWGDREPVRGRFYWEPLDARMTAAREHHVSVFLTLSSTAPEWALLEPGRDGACLMDEEALKVFLEALLTRYDNIDKIQFGNEWEAGSEGGTTYTDSLSVEKFLVYTNLLYDGVREFSPRTRVVLGGLTRTYPLAEYFLKRGAYPDLSGLTLARGFSETYLKERMDRSGADYEARGIKGNVEYILENARYDILDIHLYDDPENWPAYLSVLPKDRPIIVSEFGGPNSEWEKTDASYQARRMEDYLNAIEALPVSEAYYFKLVDSDASYHRDSGLFDKRLRGKPALSVFSRRLAPEQPEPSPE